jgi:hypothetical protein
VVQPFHLHAHAGAREKGPREEAGTVTAPVEARQDDHAGQRNQGQGDEPKVAPDAVGGADQPCGL